jgi:hypothetical protein
MFLNTFSTTPVTPVQSCSINPAPQNPGKSYGLSLGTDSILVLGIAAWLIWDRLIKKPILQKLHTTFNPIEEERKLNNLLAQIGAITNASRVILTAFHNGSIDHMGYHLIKLSTINTYVAPGRTPMAVPIRDLPVGRVMYELGMLMDAKEGEWVSIEYSDDLPLACKDHLKKNNIQWMYNRLLRVGNLPIGILSLQYDAGERRSPPIRNDPNIKLLENFSEEVSLIMRNRIVNPGSMRRLINQIKGGGIERLNSR